MFNEWKINKGNVIENNLVYYTIPSFEDTGVVKHCFTTRLGGISKFPYGTLNLGTKTKDSTENIEKNYSIICDELNINKLSIVLSDQVHKDNIKIIKQEHLSTDYMMMNKLKEIDGIITNISGIPLVTLYADCVPIFILDPKKMVVALSHGGWRGTVKKIGRKTIDLMVKEYKSKPEDILIGIGPSIGQCCYEVDEFTINEFKKNYNNINRFSSKQQNNKYLLNLWQANKISLIEAGIKESNISISGICTKCNKDTFFSYRGDNNVTGRMAAIIQLI